jgi:RHS repeat-associated protein
MGYTGHKFDTDIGLSYMQARYYDPVIGRFYSNDPVGFRDIHSFNRYAYANNNPYKFVDPDGRENRLAITESADSRNVASIGADELARRNAVRTGSALATLETLDTLSDVAVPIKGLSKLAAKKAIKEGIYEFTDSTGKKYVGQSGDIPKRLAQHEKAGKLDPSGNVKTTEVLGGKTTREVAEHNRIQEITGGVPARQSDKVSNKVDPIGPNRKHLLD